MCGISAYISENENILQFLVKSIENLQNRGYDSTGVSVVCGGKIKTVKFASATNKKKLQ